MKRTAINLLALIIPALFFFVQSASADEVFMKNGDRLTGEIVRMEEEVLVLKTSYADEKIQLNWDQVECITSDRNLVVLFERDERIIGKITCPAKGKLRIISEKIGPTKEIDARELKAVNPGTYSGYLNAGGSMATGNTDTQAANLATRFHIKTYRSRLTVEGKYNYAEADGSTSARNALGSLKYDFFTTKKLYTYAQILTQRDDFANLNLLLTQGVGVGYQFYDKRQLRLYVEAGLSYYNQDVNVGEDTKGAAGRWAAGLEYETKPKWLQLYHRQEGYYTPESGSVYIRTEQGVRIPLRDRLGAFFEVDYRYNSKPEGDKKNSDTFIIVGISYEYEYW
jgi:putative salt-induced outer membrane protein YdiY